MTKISIRASIICSSFLLFSFPATAYNPDPPSIQIQKQDQDRISDPAGPAQRVQDQHALSQETADQTLSAAHRQQACQQLQARLNNRLNQFQQTKEQYHYRYSGIHQKITGLADQLEAKGCDVSQIRNDLGSLQAHTEDFAATFRLFINYMQSARSYACEEGDASSYRQAALQARNQVATMHQAARRLHDFVLNTLKPHLRQVATSCQAQLSDSQD